MSYRARQAQPGAVISAAESRVWAELAGRMEVAEDVAAEAAAREWAVAELDRVGVPRPQKMSDSELRAWAAGG